MGQCLRGAEDGNVLAQGNCIRRKRDILLSRVRLFHIYRLQDLQMASMP